MVTSGPPAAAPIDEDDLVLRGFIAVTRLPVSIGSAGTYWAAGSEFSLAVGRVPSPPAWVITSNAWPASTADNGQRYKC